MLSFWFSLLYLVFTTLLYTYKFSPIYSMIHNMQKAYSCLKYFFQNPRWEILLRIRSRINVLIQNASAKFISDFWGQFFITVVLASISCLLIFLPYTSMWCFLIDSCWAWAPMRVESNVVCVPHMIESHYMAPYYMHSGTQR